MTGTASLYRQIMGREFDLLPDELRLFHSLKGKTRLSGRCSVKGAQTFLGRLLGRLFSLPKTTEETSLLFELEADMHQETWRRHFPDRMMASRLRVVGGMLIERLGPGDLHFRLKADNGKLTMLLAGIKVAGIPCPGFLVPRIVAEETASPGKLHFHVAAHLPVIGLLVAYQGFLNLASDEAAL